MRLTPSLADLGKGREVSEDVSYLESQSPFYFFLKMNHRESEHSLQAESSSTLSSPYEYDLELTSSEEKMVAFLQKKAVQLGPEGAAQARVSEPVKGEKKRDKRVSYLDMARGREFRPRARTLTDSLVSIGSKDVLFKKDDRANVYPLVSVTRFCVSPGTLRVL